MKTKQQILAEIAALEAIRPQVREFDRFGTSNRAAIDAQLDVLQNVLDTEQARAKYSHDEGVQIPALIASDWLFDRFGDDGTLADDWAPLVISAQPAAPTEATGPLQAASQALSHVSVLCEDLYRGR